MVGLPWEQHVTFLDDPGRADSIEARVREGVRACAGHPAVFGYRRRQRDPRAHRALARAQAHRALPQAALPGREGRGSRRAGHLRQLSLDRVPRAALPRLRLLQRLPRGAGIARGLPRPPPEPGRRAAARDGGDRARQSPQRRGGAGAGARLAAAHDQRGRLRRSLRVRVDGRVAPRRVTRSTTGTSASPAATAAPSRRWRPCAEAYAAMPVRAQDDWPMVSVVVCTYNGSSTLPECLDSVLGLRLPELRGHRRGRRLHRRQRRARPLLRGPGDHHREPGPLERPQRRAPRGDRRDRGLHRRRRLPRPGLAHLPGAVVSEDRHAGVGGPNIPPLDAGLGRRVRRERARGADARAALRPGRRAHPRLQHGLPEGRASRRSGASTPSSEPPATTSTSAGSCRSRGWTLGYNAAAMVWHYRRGSVRTYWKQQRGYGRAEALVERKWPEKYNRAGHVSWAGRIYGKGLAWPLGSRKGRVFHGTWGGALFQRLYQQPPGTCRVPAPHARVVPGAGRTRRDLRPRACCGRRCWSACPSSSIALGAAGRPGVRERRPCTCNAERLACWASAGFTASRRRST